MIKFRLYLDKDQETKWLNGLCDQGWAMTGFFVGFYWFEKCEPGAYRYQVDFEERFFSVSNEYREFMNDVGVDIIQCWGYWVILRKAVSDGAFELYSDADSKIEHYTRIRKMFKVVTIFEMACLCLEIMAAVAGNAYAVLFACILGAIVIALINMAVRTTWIIDQLKEGKTGMKDRRNISGILAAGLLCNACALLSKEYVSVYVWRTIQIIALLIMLIGIWDTCRKRND